MSDQTVQVLIVGALDAQVATADVVDGLVVNHEAAIGVFQGGMCCQDGVVRLHDRGGDLRCGIDTKLELALLAIVDGQSFHQQSTEAGSGASTKRVEDQKSLQTGAVVRNASNLVQNLVDELLANGVVAASIVVGRVFLAGDHVLGVEEAAIGAGANFVDDVRLKVAVDGARNVLALACRDVSFRFCERASFERTRLGEEGAEALVIVGSFALLSEESVGLPGSNVSDRSSRPNFCPSNVPGYRVRGSRAIRRRS